MTPQETQALLDRYLLGQTTAREHKLIEDWLEQSGRANEQWTNIEHQNLWLSALFNDIDIAKNTTALSPAPNKKFKLYALLKFASAAVLLICALGWYIAQQSALKPFVALANPKQITLSDGSHVWLNTGAELSYVEDFGTNKREVNLSGEAYFDVVHDANRPFIVRTKSISTQVLGTAFNIKANRQTDSVEITVVRGKVRVSKGNQLLGTLRPNQQLNVPITGQQVSRQTVDPTPILAWQHDELLFDDITFEAATQQLEKEFNVKITFENEKSKQCRFTGSTPRGAKLEQILKVICALNQATYVIQSNGNILIKGAGCPS